MSNQEPKHEKEYDLTGIPPLEEEFTLEEILSEFGGSLEQMLLRQAEGILAAEGAPAEPPSAPAEEPASPSVKPTPALAEEPAPPPAEQME